MMRKNNNQNRNNNMKHRGGQGGGQRRYNNNGGGGGGNRGNDSGNIQRQKHHATQMREKYSNMARDAQNNGDRVDVEYYLQHVDHYTRVLTDIAAIEAERHSHTREQYNQNHQNDQQQGDQPQGDAQASSGEGQDHQQPQSAHHEGGENNQSSDDSAPVEVTQSRQPRMTRSPRRPHHSDNGAKEANSNTTEIPLPDSILPPV